MIDSCLNGDIDRVLTKSSSRFARNTVDTVTIISRLKEKGIGVYFEKENIFMLDSKDKFLLTIMSSLAQEESRAISENVKWGQRKAFRGRQDEPCVQPFPRIRQGRREIHDGGQLGTGG